MGRDERLVAACQNESGLGQRLQPAFLDAVGVEVVSLTAGLRDRGPQARESCRRQLSGCLPLAQPTGHEGVGPVHPIGANQGAEILLVRRWIIRIPLHPVGQIIDQFGIASLRFEEPRVGAAQIPLLPRAARPFSDRGPSSARRRRRGSRRHWRAPERTAVATKHRARNRQPIASGVAALRPSAPSAAGHTHSDESNFSCRGDGPAGGRRSAAIDPAGSGSRSLEAPDSPDRRDVPPGRDPPAPDRRSWPSRLGRASPNASPRQASADAVPRGVG